MVTMDKTGGCFILGTYPCKPDGANFSNERLSWLRRGGHQDQEQDGDALVLGSQISATNDATFHCLCHFSKKYC